IDVLPGVNKTAFGLAVPWRNVGGSGFGLQFSADGHTHTPGEDPRAQLHVVSEPIVTIYSTFEKGPIFGGRLFIHTSADPYSLVAPVTRIIRNMSADQPVEHAATLEDVRAEVLTPDRLNSLVFGVFAAVALAIALVGVAGVLAFSVSARTREFGIRLALGSQPQLLLKGVIADGAVMAGAGLLAGAAFGFVLARLAGHY